MARQKYRIPDQKSVTYGIPAEEIAMICEVSLRTACRWKSGATKMPPTARMLLCADLGCVDLDWSGWTIRRGMLISPEGWQISRPDVTALPLLRQRIAAYESEIRRFNAKLLSMQEQPLPTEWPEWVSQLSAG